MYFILVLLIDHGNLDFPITASFSLWWFLLASLTSVIHSNQHCIFELVSSFSPVKISATALLLLSPSSYTVIP
jgi:hypothetical protein